MLLDSGSTSAIRRAAAKQIGEIQHHHPEQLFVLLNLVIPLARHNSWDTRVAAGHAMGEIAAAFAEWRITNAEYSRDQLVLGRSFAQLDIHKLIASNDVLVASGPAFNVLFTNLISRKKLNR